jgi:hypothetical protein
LQFFSSMIASIMLWAPWMVSIAEDVAEELICKRMSVLVLVRRTNDEKGYCVATATIDEDDVDGTKELVNVTRDKILQEIASKPE